MYVCMYACIFVFICLYIYTCMYVSIFMYAHTSVRRTELGALPVPCLQGHAAAAGKPPGSFERQGSPASSFRES